MKKPFLFLSLIICLLIILPGCSEKKYDSNSIIINNNITDKDGYASIFDKININNVKDIRIENLSRQKAKNITKPKDISSILNEVNKLKFRAIAYKDKDKGNVEDVNYSITIELKPSDIVRDSNEIILNINKDNISYSGFWYKVNSNNIQDYIESFYFNSNYEETSVYMKK